MRDPHHLPPPRDTRVPVGRCAGAALPPRAAPVHRKAIRLLVAQMKVTSMGAHDAPSEQANAARDHRRPIAAYALGMAVLLVLFSLGGENGAVYAVPY